MPTVEKNNLSDLLLYEMNQRFCRKNVVVAALAAAHPLGTVLGQVTATGKYVPLAPAANNGSQNAVAVLITPLEVSAGDQAAQVIKRWSVINVDALVWPNDIGNDQKNAAITQLDALGIVAEVVL